MAKSRQRSPIEKVANRLAEIAVALGFFGIVGVVLALMLTSAVVAALYERAEIETRNVPVPQSAIDAARNSKRGGLDTETVVKAARNDVLRGFSGGVGAGMTQSHREGFIPLKEGRHPSQPRGSAVIPASPTDPWRQAHTRMQSANQLREAASRVLENRASLRQMAQRDHFLAALYADERSRAQTSLVRREAAVVIMLTIAGLMAVWGIE